MDLSKVSTEDLRKELSRRGYAVGNLWSVPDVTDRYKTDDETALNILNDALSAESIMDDVYYKIDYFAQEIGLEYVDQED